MENTTPTHIAFIMDGNNRWAQARNLQTAQGHQAGASNIRTIVDILQKQGILYATIFAFSTENWNRPKKEVDNIMEILSQTLDTEMNALHKSGVRLQCIGDTTRLPDTLQTKIQEVLVKTQNNTKITLCVAINYGGRNEIINATKAMLQQNIDPDAITEQSFSQFLHTKDIPNPDIVIRTGGHKRLSNFLLWQCAYSELFFTNTLWPDLNEQEIHSIIQSYIQTKRNFGAR